MLRLSLFLISIYFISILYSCESSNNEVNYDFSKNSINIEYNNEIWDYIPFFVFYKLYLSPKTVYKVDGETLITTTYNRVLIKFSFNINFHRLEKIIEHYKYRYNIYISDFKIDVNSIKGDYDSFFFKRKYNDIMNVLSFEMDLNSFGDKKIYINEEHSENFDLKYFEYQIFHIINSIYPPIFEEKLKNLKYETSSLFYPIIFNPEIDENPENSKNSIQNIQKQDIVTIKNGSSEIKPSFDSFLESFKTDNIIGNRVYLQSCGCYSDIKMQSLFSKNIIYENKMFEYNIKNFYNISIVK
ncbi:hypothetical protein JXR93_09460 [bacterium]|nr:hypothetical protein [bacterium]